MTTRITGTGVETSETDTDTLTGGITDGQLIRGLLDRGLSLNSNGEIVVENAQKIAGQSVMELLGQYSFDGRQMRGNGDGRVMNTVTDASGNPASIQVAPGQDYDITNFSGTVTQNGSEHIGEPGGEYTPPIRYQATEQLPAKELLWQLQSFDNTPIMSVENGASARTTFFNGTIVAGGDRSGQKRDSVGTRYLFGNTAVQLRGSVNGGIVAMDKNGNSKILI